MQNGLAVSAVGRGLACPATAKACPSLLSASLPLEHCSQVLQALRGVTEPCVRLSPSAAAVGAARGVRAGSGRGRRIDCAARVLQMVMPLLLAGPWGVGWVRLAGAAVAVWGGVGGTEVAGVGSVAQGRVFALMHGQHIHIPLVLVHNHHAVHKEHAGICVRGAVARGSK